MNNGVNVPAGIVDAKMHLPSGTMLDLLIMVLVKISDDNWNAKKAYSISANDFNWVYGNSQTDIHSKLKTLETEISQKPLQIEVYDYSFLDDFELIASVGDNGLEIKIPRVLEVALQDYVLKRKSLDFELTKGKVALRDFPDHIPDSYRNAKKEYIPLSVFEHAEYQKGKLDLVLGDDFIRYIKKISLARTPDNKVIGTYIKLSDLVKIKDKHTKRIYMMCKKWATTKGYAFYNYLDFKDKLGLPQIRNCKMVSILNEAEDFINKVFAEDIVITWKNKNSKQREEYHNLDKNAILQLSIENKKSNKQKEEKAETKEGEQTNDN